MDRRTYYTADAAFRVLLSRTLMLFGRTVAVKKVGGFKPMSIERSHEFILTALYLSRCGRQVEGGTPLPPAELGTDSWSVAYAAFFDQLGGGRTLRSFHNSMKATRDQFDSHVESGRTGWLVKGKPKPLPEADAAILKEWRGRTDRELWTAVSAWADPAIGSVPKSVLADLEAESDEADERVTLGREGSVKAVVSRRRERSPTLRAAALRIHGYRCQVCDFSFAEAYGEWGKGFAEVHHVKELSEASDTGIDTNPETDLAVLCSNCHQMIHRKPKRALSLHELQQIVKKAKAS